MRLFFRLILALALMLVATLGYAYWETQWPPVVRRADIGLRDWPAGAPPVTVLLVSDSHVAGPDMPPARLTRIVDTLNGLRPDLVLLAGDYISERDIATRHYTVAQAVAPLARLHAPLGVVAVLGNHDHFVGATEFQAAFRAAGIPLLANQAVRRGPLILAGVDDDFSGYADLPATARALAPLGPGPRIVFTHAPDIARRLPFRADAVLAGHTHCGQLNLPFYGSIARLRSPDEWLPCGRLSIGGMPLIVTGGLGTSILPLRLGARPDVWLIRFGPLRNAALAGEAGAS